MLRLLVTVGASDLGELQIRRLIAGSAIFVTGCGSVEIDATAHDRCEDITVESYCSRPGGCRSLDERVSGSEGLCDRGLDTFAHVFVAGCGFTELRTVGWYPSESRWFDTTSGSLVGFSWLSDTEPECNGTFVGSQRPADCDSVSIPECTVCGWDTCEWLTCGNEIGACAFAFPCTNLWECSHETGCEGEECANAEVCPGFSLSSAQPALEALDALLSCVGTSGCLSQCPLSMRIQ